MKNSEKWALATAAVGAASVAAGLIIFFRSRRGLQGNVLGYLETTVKRDGATAKVYTSRMPIEERLGHIQDMVYKTVKDPQMRHLALAITGAGTQQVKVGSRVVTVRGANCPARDGLCEARAVYNWTRANVRYSGDIAPIKMGRNGPVEGIDVFQSGARTVEYGAEDCDGHTVLNSALLSLNGITPKMAVTAPKKYGPEGHIYAMAALPKNAPKELVAIDTTLPGEYFGKEAPYGRRKLYDA